MDGDCLIVTQFIKVMSDRLNDATISPKNLDSVTDPRDHQGRDIVDITSLVLDGDSKVFHWGSVHHFLHLRHII